MPGFNGQGPLGKGSFTGRGRGYCIENIDSVAVPLDGGQGMSKSRRTGFHCHGLNSSGRRRLSFFRGQCYGNRIGNFSGQNEADEKSYLEREAQVLKKRMEYLENRLRTIEERKS